jgi:hypothetical protein
MCLKRKSREFLADYAKDRTVSIVDGTKNRYSVVLVVLKLLKKYFGELKSEIDIS